jgi:putative ABC transport system substrate-binding protein
MLTRRSAIIAATASPHLVARANERPHIAIIGASNPSSLQAFLRRLAALGYEDGRNVVVTVQRISALDEPVAPFIDAVIRNRPTVIVTGSTITAGALRRQTSTIPIVLTTAADPVGAGLAESLARPGRNVTGLTAQGHDLYGKWVELARELLPGLGFLLGLSGPSANPGIEHHKPAFLAAANQMRIDHAIVDLDGTDDIGRVARFIQDRRPDAVLLFYHPTVLGQLDALQHLLTPLRIPIIAPFRFQTERGALASYGAITSILWERAADFVARILRGADPATLPIEQPTRFELVINLRVARELGIEIPQALLMRADDVIE